LITRIAPQGTVTSHPRTRDTYRPTRVRCQKAEKKIAKPDNKPMSGGSSL
jgi:hypothetical protein